MDMDSIKDIKSRYNISLHKLYHLIKAEWYGYEEDVSDNFDEWVEDFIIDEEHNYKYDCSFNRDAESIKPFILYISGRINAYINEYYLKLGASLLKHGNAGS